MSLDMFDADPGEGERKDRAPHASRASAAPSIPWPHRVVCCQTYKETAAARGHVARMPGPIFDSMGSPTHVVWKLHDTTAV